MKRALMMMAAVCALTACDDDGAADAGTGPTPDVAPADTGAEAGGGDASPTDAAADVGPTADAAPDAAAVDGAPGDAAADATPLPDADLDAALAADGAAADAGPGAACPGPFAVLAPQRDLRYGPADRQVYDIYLPDAPGPFPVFVWIHGGGWRSNTQANVPRTIAGLAERGLAVISIDYRLSDTAFPTTISDVRSAIRWVRTDGPAMGLDPRRIAVGGSSAGGHLAAMLGTAADVDALDLEPSAISPSVDLVIDFYGPSALLMMDDDAAENGCGEEALCHDCAGSPEALLIDCEAELSTCPEPATLASPITHVDGDEPPFVVLHGDQDCTVATPQGRRMHAALVAAGVESTLHITPGAGHNTNQVGTPEAWALVYDALDRHILECDRPAPEPRLDAGVERPDLGPLEPLDECLFEECPDETAVCDADPRCIALDECIRACLGMNGCIATCTEGVPQATIAAHRPMFDCGRPAGCYR